MMMDEITEPEFKYATTYAAAGRPIPPRALIPGTDRYPRVPPWMEELIVALRLRPKAPEL